MMKVCITRGAGYVGSHIAVELLNSGHEVVIIDNFINSNPSVLERVNRITGNRPTVFKGDMTDVAFLRTVFESQDIATVIHCAGLKAVGELGVKRLVFSSSATVYSQPQTFSTD